MNVYEIITEKITKQLEAGCAPWHKPWGSRGASSIPKNMISGKEYRGINVWLLMASGYSSPYWLTYKQATELGGNVRKGEKGSPVVFWKFGTYEKENTSTHETESRDSVLVRYYTVFNVSQCENLRVEPQPALEFPELPPIETAERIIANWTTKPTIRTGQNQASYHKMLDYVNMPAMGDFESPELYYSILFHELTHSTGHPKRLNRATLTDMEKFGDANYSREELVAEMGAAFLCGFAGIENKTLGDSVSYIAGWLKALKDDARLVLVAAGQAQKAADMILGPAASNVTTEPVPDVA